jgi:hypothetical protein
MRSYTTHGLLGVALAIAVAAGVGFTVRPQAQEIAEDEVEKVSEDEIKLYIDVYGAMQADHDLTIDQALGEQKQSVTLTQFRELERRIQREEGLVERVRKALLDQAKARAASIGPLTGKTEEPVKDPPH